MTPAQLKAECNRVICGVTYTELPLPERPQVQLLLARKAPRGKRLYLSGRKSPKGWFVAETERGVLARFDALEVLEWLER